MISLELQKSYNICLVRTKKYTISSAVETSDQSNNVSSSTLKGLKASTLQCGSVGPDVKILVSDLFNLQMPNKWSPVPVLRCELLQLLLHVLN